MRARTRRSVHAYQDLRAQFEVEVDDLTVHLDARGSTGDPNVYTWEFGDGGTAQGPRVTYRFPNRGTYQVKLTVIDAFGNQDITSKAVEVAPQRAPTPVVPLLIVVAAGYVLFVD